MAHMSSLWAVQAERGIRPTSPHLYGRPPGCCSHLSPGTRHYRKSNAVSHWVCLPSAPLPFFLSDSFVVLIHHEKARSHEMTVCKVTFTIRVTGLEDMDSEHLWLLINKKMLSFRDHTCPKSILFIIYF